MSAGMLMPLENLYQYGICCGCVVSVIPHQIFGFLHLLTQIIIIIIIIPDTALARKKT